MLKAISWSREKKLYDWQYSFFGWLTEHKFIIIHIVQFSFPSAIIFSPIYLRSAKILQLLLCSLEKSFSHVETQDSCFQQEDRQAWHVVKVASSVCSLCTSKKRWTSVTIADSSERLLILILSVTWAILVSEKETSWKVQWQVLVLQKKI